jgi:hypothetical protein
MKHTCLFITLCIFSLMGKTASSRPAAVANSFKPVIMPFRLPVVKVISLPIPSCVAVQTPAGENERQLVFVTFVNRDYFVLDPVPLDDFTGRIISVLGTIDETKLLLLQPSGLSVFDLRMKIVTAEYATVMPRIDLEPQYFQAMVVNNDPLTVIAEIQPSIDSEGVVDPTQHSLVFDEVKRKKTNGRISLMHPLKEHPPVFFNSDIIIYRNSRKDISEPWKALDKSFTPVQYPLCTLLDTTFKRSIIWEIALSRQYRCAVVYAVDRVTSLPAFTYVSSDRTLPIPLPAGILVGQKNFMLSPSGRWVFFTAYLDNNDNRTMNHFVLDLELGPATVPRMLAEAAKNDGAAWMNSPEALVIFSAEKVCVWDMPKSQGKKATVKQRKR